MGLFASLESSDPIPTARGAPLHATRAVSRGARKSRAASAGARPAGDQGDEGFLAGDAVAAPGMLAEVSVNSAVRAARLAVAARRRRAWAPGWPAVDLTPDRRLAILAAALPGAELRTAYPEADVVVMEGFDAEGPARRPAIAVMTRGSVVRRPAWLADATADVLVLPDADALLGRPRYDAAEDLLRLCLTAVWTRHMVIQTRQPAHPAIQALVRWDPDGFWRGEAARRAALGYPPSRVLVNVDLPTGDAETLTDAMRSALPPDDELTGPDLDGRVVVKSNDPRGTLSALDPVRRRWARQDRRVTVDVDPVPSLDRIAQPGPMAPA